MILRAGSMLSTIAIVATISSGGGLGAQSAKLLFLSRFDYFMLGAFVLGLGVMVLIISKPEAKPILENPLASVTEETRENVSTHLPAYGFLATLLLFFILLSFVVRKISS